MSDDLTEDSDREDVSNPETIPPPVSNQPARGEITIEDVQPRDNEIDDANGDLFLDTEDKDLGMSRQLPPKNDQSDNDKLPEDSTDQ